MSIAPKRCRNCRVERRARQHVEQQNRMATQTIKQQRNIIEGMSSFLMRNDNSDLTAVKYRWAQLLLENGFDKLLEEE